MSKDYLELYSKNCLRCAYLVEHATRKYEACHHTAGNSDCPAGEIRIITTGKVRRAAELIKEARAAKSPTAEADILKRVADESPAFLHLLYELIS